MSLGGEAWRRFRRDRAAFAAFVFLAVVFAGSLAAPLLPRPSPRAIALQDEPVAPVPPWEARARGGFRAADAWGLSAVDRGLVGVRESLFGDLQTAPWLGTDAKGRDLLARVVWGSRTSILAAAAAALASLAIGVTWGLVAGFSGRRTDEMLMRAVDALQSLPFLFLVIFLIGVVAEYRAELARFGIGREAVFYLVLGAVSWLPMARLVRGQVLGLRRSAFVEAARVAGASTPRILAVHVLPNVLPVVLVALTLTLPTVMLAEAFLSFLGLGIEPPKVSWGILAADGTEAINPIRIAWWLVLAPALAMGSVLFALNVVGDGLRDAIDPKLRGRTG